MLRTQQFRTTLRATTAEPQPPTPTSAFAVSRRALLHASPPVSKETNRHQKTQTGTTTVKTTHPQRNTTLVLSIQIYGCEQQHVGKKKSKTN